MSSTKATSERLPKEESAHFQCLRYIRIAKSDHEFFEKAFDAQVNSFTSLRRGTVFQVRFSFVELRSVQALGR